jgi:P4 family phage/plasmid primase-like protien
VQQEKQREKSELERRQQYEKVSKECTEFWNGLSSSENVLSSYLVRKGVDVLYGARVINDVLYVPAMDVEGKIWSLQEISSNGSKRFSKGGKVLGTFFCIGCLTDAHRQGLEPVLLVEGFATGVSCHMATNLPVIVAFFAGNLLSVVQVLTSKHSCLKIINCADDDQFTVVNGVFKNRGRDVAQELSKFFKFPSIFPKFMDLSSKPTDFNDLHTLGGINVVKTQILESLGGGGLIPPPQAPNCFSDSSQSEESQLCVISSRLRPKLVYYDSNGVARLLKQNEAAKVIASDVRQLRFDAVTEGWMIWRDNYWQRTSDSVALKTINDVIYTNSMKLGYSIGYVHGVSSFLKWELMIEQWNEQRELIPLKNGLLNLKTKTLVPHVPELNLIWQLPYDYDPKATCEPIMKWLKDTVKDDAQVELLRAYLNCIVLGRVNLQRYLEIIGPGGSGKGTFIRLAESLVGGVNTHVTELKRLESGDASRFETARLYGKRLVIITDAEKFSGDVSTLKAITGEDPLPYEEKNKQGSRPNFRSQAMVLIAANEPIQSSDYTTGLARRRITIRFDNSVMPSMRRDLEREFEPYLPGLLNWVLAMDEKRVRELILNTDEYVKSLSLVSKENLIATNPLAAWLDVCVVHDEDVETKVGRSYRNDDKGGYRFSDSWLYPSFCEFCETSGMRPVSMRRFSDLLVDLCRNQLHLKGVSKLPRAADGAKISGLRLRFSGDLSFSPLDMVFGV